MTISEPYKLKLKETLQLALPIIAGQLGQVLMGFFDTIQIGGLGKEYIAASGFANGIYWMIILLGMGILFAVSPLVSEAFGEGKEYKSIGVLISSLLVSLVLTLVFMVIISTIASYLPIFRHTETDNILAGKFLHLVNYSTGFVFFFMAAKQFLDGMGRTKIGMQITIAGLILNCILNRLLIYGELGLPQMGIEGAAIANGISRGAMAIVILIFIWKDEQIAELRKEYAKHISSIWSYVKSILIIGIPAGLQFFWEVAAFNAGQIMSGWISTSAEAAHMISIGLASITFMVLTGISASGTIMIGYSYGAKDKEGIRMAGNTVFLLTLFIELIFAGFFFSCHSLLPKLYTDNFEVISIASSMLFLAAIFQISDGFQAVAVGALRGMQDVKIPAAIAFVSYWLIMIPACYLLAFHFHFGLKGIWIGFIIGLTVAALSQMARFGYMLKKLNFTTETQASDL